MKKHLTLGSALLATLLVPEVAMAQGGVGTGTGQPIASTNPAFNRRNNTEFENLFNVRALFDNPVASAHAYDIALETAGCIVRANSSRAAEMIGGPMTKDVNYSRLSGDLKGRYRSCTKDQQVATMLISSAIAEHLVLDEKPAALEDRAMAVNVDQANAFQGGEMSGGVTLDKLTRCLAVYSPGLSRNVLGTKPGSPEEVSALDTLYSRTPECGLESHPESAPATLQRAAIASGLFHWERQSK